MTRVLAILLACSWPLQSMAAEPVAAPQPTVQQLFDGGSDALANGRPAEALAQFDQLQLRFAQSKASTRSRAVVAVRKGRALAGLGRADEALQQIDAGLTGLPDVPDLLDDRIAGLIARADISEQALDYAAARRDYTAVQQLAVANGDRLTGLLGIARTAMFDDPPKALKAVDDSFLLLPRDAKSDAEKRTWRDFEGQLYTLRGRIRLNQGEIKGAKGDLDKALSLLGGLTRRVSLSDISARSDLAVAAMLDHDDEAARKYFAYTGAGHLDQYKAVFSAGLDLPPCGGLEGINPEDFAIVDFDVRDDGTVGIARPVYGSRPGLDVLAFARAVRGWTWKVDEVKEIKPFFRQFVRFQLRCSNHVDGPAPTGILRAETDHWLASRGARLIDGTKPLSVLQAELGARERAGAGPLDLLAVLLRIATARSDPSTAAQANARALEIARTTGAPAPFIAMLQVQAIENSSLGKSASGYSRSRSHQLALNLVSQLGDPAINGDAVARALVLMTAADNEVKARRDPDALALLQKLIVDPALAEQDPFRLGAQIRIASIQARAGRMDEAHRAFAATGLSEGQCSLMDVQPALRNDPAGPGSFPMDAMRWGFDGVAITEFDIDASGRTANVRAVVSYPPFVFEKAAVSIARNARYTQSFRPSGGLGCGGKIETIRFKANP